MLRIQSFSVKIDKMFNFNRFLSVVLVLVGFLQGLAYKVGTGNDDF